MGDEGLIKWTKWAEEMVQNPRSYNYQTPIITLPEVPADRNAAVLGITQVLKLNRPTLTKIRYAPPQYKRASCRPLTL
jgi:hypothetical protein